MTIFRSWLSILTLGSILLGLNACTSNSSDSTEDVSSKETEPSNLPPVDLDPAIAKRIEGKTAEALIILRSLAELYPQSVEVLIQLARTLMDERDFPLAAFRFEEALSKGASTQVAKEAAEAHYLCGDYEAATDRYEQYLKTAPNDPDSQLRYARLLARQGRPTESINAFFQASDRASSEDCQLMGKLFLSKKLLPQAKHWFEESIRRTDGPSAKPLFGLLQVAIAGRKESEAETLILAIEKFHSGYLESTDLASYSGDLLRRRRLADLISRGVDARSMSVTELASGLIAGSFSSSSIQESVTSFGPKLSGGNVPKNKRPAQQSVAPELPNDIEISPERSPENISLADAFSAPIEKTSEVNGASESPLDLGRKAFIDTKYTLALMHARDALKSDSQNPSAWMLCSQAHFQLGEIDAAEMTILEAIRHDPMNEDIRLDYLRIARETLPADRYLQELEKSRDTFPDSVEILWELARRYHLVEKMPVTASILYRKVLDAAPSNSSIAQQAALELTKVEKP